MDRIIPIPGWTLPGVFTLGGAQVALKAQGCRHRPALHLAGHRAAALSRSHINMPRPAPSSPRCSIPPASRSALPGPARAARQAAAPWPRACITRSGSAPAASRSGTASSRSKSWAGRALPASASATGRASSAEIQGDAVAMGFGLKPETQLADLAGCAFGFDEAEPAMAAADGWRGPRPRGGGRLSRGRWGRHRRRRCRRARGRAGGARPARRPRHPRQQRQAARDRAPAGPDRALPRRGWRRPFPFPPSWRASSARCDDPLPLRGGDRGRARAPRSRKRAEEINRAKAFCRVGMGRCQGRALRRARRRRSWRPRAASSSPPSAGCAASRR